MAVITRDQLENASQDANDLGQIVGGAPDRSNPGHASGTVTTRLGQTVRTASKVMADVAETLSISGYTLFPSGHPAALDRILTIRLVGADQTKFARVSNFFYHDVGNRASLQVAIANDAAGTGSTLVAQFSDGGTGITLSGRQRIELAEVGGSGVTGYAIVDFGNGSTAWAAYNATYATAGLPIGTMIPQVDVGDQVDDAIAAYEAKPKGVFNAGGSVVPYIADLVVEVGVEGGDKGHFYGIGAYETVYFPTAGTGGAGFYRINLTVKDFTLGIDVAKYSLVQDLGAGGVEPTVANGFLEEWCFAYGNGTMRNGYVGITAMIRCDWSKLLWNKTFADVPTYALGGFLPELVHSNDDMDGFLWAPNPRKTLTVGAGTPTATHFNSVTAAAASLYKKGLVPNNQSTTLPWSNVCGYTRQVVIQVIDNYYSEDINEVLMLPYLTIRGKGMGNTTFYHSSPDTNERLLEFRHSGCIEDCTLVQRGPAYIIHADAFNDWGVVASAGPAIQWHRNRKVLRRCELRAEATSGTAWGWGSGISSWEYCLFEDCVFRRPSTTLTAAFLGIHTTPGMSRGATVHLRRCVADSFFNTEVVLISGFAQDQLNTCIVEGGNIKLVNMGCSFANNASDMPLLARNRATWQTQGDVPSILNDANMTVMGVPPGTVLGGSAAGIAALFGTGYDQKHGRGERLVNDALTLRRLPTILGDRTGTPWNITFNGNAYNFNANYTGMTEAAILAAVNAVLGAGFLSVVRLDNKIVPLSAQQRYIAASQTVGEKRFVTIEADKVRLAHGAAKVVASLTNGSAVMTVAAVTSGTLEVGQLVTGPGIPLNTTIASFGTSTGGTGTVNLSANATATNASAFVEGIADRVDGWTMEAMATNGADIVVEARTFGSAYIPEFVAAGDGNYGVVNGVPTKYALPTVCKVNDGVATLVG